EGAWARRGRVALQRSRDGHLPPPLLPPALSARRQVPCSPDAPSLQRFLSLGRLAGGASPRLGQVLLEALQDLRASFRGTGSEHPVPIGHRLEDALRPEKRLAAGEFLERQRLEQ